MLLSAIFMPLAQAASLAPAAPTAISYVILGDEHRRGRLERLLTDIKRTGFAGGADSEGGMAYAGCAGTWRDDAPQAIACMQSRMPRRIDARTVVLNTYERTARQGEIVVSCVGSGGHSRLVLPSTAAPGDAPALRACMLAAADASSVAPEGIHITEIADELETGDLARERARAAIVLKIALDHVGVPRGNTGICLVQGRIEEVLSGSQPIRERLIGLSIPCIGMRGVPGARRIWMGDLREGSFAYVYLSEEHRLIDFQPALN